MNQIAKQITTEAFRDNRLNVLNSWQETFFHRILVACDEDGRLNADPSFVKTTLFPLKTDLRVSQVANALTTLNSVGLITLEKDNQGHPTSLTVSRDLTTRTHESASLIGGGRGCGDGGGYLINYINPKGNDGYETRKDELGDKPSWGNEDTDNLVVTQEEADRYRKAFEAVEKSARNSGLLCSQNALDYAMDLVREYGLDSVVKAINQSFDTPKWKYVAGILRIARERGEAVDAPKKAEKKASKWYSSETAAEAEKRAAEKWGESFSGFDEFDT